MSYYIVRLPEEEVMQLIELSNTEITSDNKNEHHEINFKIDDENCEGHFSTDYYEDENHRRLFFNYTYDNNKTREKDLSLSTADGNIINAMKCITRLHSEDDFIFGIDVVPQKEINHLYDVVDVFKKYPLYAAAVAHFLYGDKEGNKLVEFCTCKNFQIENADELYIYAGDLLLEYESSHWIGNNPAFINERIEEKMNSLVDMSQHRERLF